ncbi:hypothetical protein [Corallococcus exercitus]|uniref:hypothetical protein n=1 Tax=Corallococcus exercitus TaxID=2316736 RepID=UPI0035D43791
MKPFVDMAGWSVVPLDLLASTARPYSSTTELPVPDFGAVVRKVFIANFGQANRLWPSCLGRSTVATFEDEDLRPLWLARDREGYIARCLATKKTATGITPTKAVASRWYNLATIISETNGDLWLHHEKDDLWWTTTLPGAPDVLLDTELRPSHLSERVFLMHKPATPWSNRSKTGSPLRWNALHPRARDFLFIQGTFHELSGDNAAYAEALVAGDDIEPWHRRPSWKARSQGSGKGAVTAFTGKRRAVVRMAMTAIGTTASSNGQQVLRTVKNKELRFASQHELEGYISALVDSQDGLCALTGLRLQYDGESDDPELLCSLDRIDSSGHYEAGNLQVVCRFANRWKSDGDDASFRRLLQLVRLEGDV